MGIETSIGIAIISAAEAATGAAIGFTAASTVGTIAIGATLVAANYALQSSVPDAGGIGATGAGVINTPSARGSTNQPASPQRRVYGRMLIGGGWLFYDDAHPPYQYLMLGLARGRIEAVRSLIINNNRVIFSNGTPFSTILDPLAVDGQDYAGHLKACFRQGLSDQEKDQLLDADFPSAGSLPDDIVFDDSGLNVVNLPTSFMQRGYATASFRADFGATQDIYAARWGNVPFINPLVEVDGHPVFDPRDPSQVLGEETTYKFYYNGGESGRNASLVQCDWLCYPAGGRLRPDQIRLDELAASAERDDEIVFDMEGNPRRRNQCDGLVSLSDNPRQVTEAMLTANAAWIVQSRGRVGWVPAIDRTASITITESDLLGGFDFQDSPATADQFNRVRTRFPAPEKNYAEDDGPVVDRSDLRDGEDGGVLLDTVTRTTFTTDQRAVQWLAGEFLDTSRIGKGLEIPALRNHPRILRRKIGDVIRVAFSRYPQVNGLYQIKKDSLADDWSSIGWSLRAFDGAIFTKDRSADEKPFQIQAA
jgi:hypothetical protein